MKKPGEAIPNHLLRGARELRGWTQEELAEKIGTTSVNISRWENGITVPNPHFRKKLSDIYDRSLTELGLDRSFKEPGLRAGDESSPASPLFYSPSTSPNKIPSRRSGAFFFNKPLPDAGEFYGRWRERDTLLDRTYRKASTSIIGPRRIGKTWLVDYLRLTAHHELGSRFHVGYLDGTMPSCKTVDGFVSGALEALGLTTIGRGEGLVSLEKGLKALKAKNHVPVLCIDEFEGLGNRQEFTLDFFRGLRAMTQTFGLVLVVVSRHPLSMVVGKDVETSGFFNVFEQLTLEPFTIEEAKSFIDEKSAQAGFSQWECECLWHYGEVSGQGWPPLRLQLVGKMLLEERGQAKNVPNWKQRFEQRLETTYQGVVY